MHIGEIHRGLYSNTLELLGPLHCYKLWGSEKQRDFFQRSVTYKANSLLEMMLNADKLYIFFCYGKNIIPNFVCLQNKF
jgi:hypothetical protein